MLVEESRVPLEGRVGRQTLLVHPPPEQPGSVARDPQRPADEFLPEVQFGEALRKRRPPVVHHGDY